MESRLRRRSSKETKKQLYGSLIAIVVILFIAINFGPHLIGALGSFIDVLTGKARQTTIIVSDADLQAPNLDPVPEATPSSRIDITGRAFYEDGQIEIYVNDVKEDTIELENSQEFEAEDIVLKAGENIIQARMVRGKQKSGLSEELTISYIKDAPKLEVEAPTDGTSFSKADQEITVKGKTDPNNTVTVSGFRAITDGDGNFSYLYRLNDGENKIKLIAENLAGNTTVKEITVSYSP